MSETKLATKADLKEMYDRMLPYMGGMPEMLANKFSKGDLYSTDEKMIGQWIDGKPLYAKTFTKIFQSTDENTWQTLGSIGDVNIAYYQACLKTANGSFMFKDDGYSTGDYRTQEMYHSSILKVESGNLKAFLSFASISRDFPATYFITLYYTKTSDSAVSIGDETDYSTTEKIVGTWIDGKPIYQKTFSEFITLDDSSKEMQYDHNIANIDNVISASGFSKNPTNNRSYAFPQAYSDTYYYFLSANSLKINVERLNPLGWAGHKCTATLQYTKTTD